MKVLKFFFGFIAAIILILGILYLLNKKNQSDEIKISFDDGSYFETQIPTELYYGDQAFLIKLSNFMYYMISQNARNYAANYDTKYIASLSPNRCTPLCILLNQNQPSKVPFVIFVKRADKLNMQNFCKIANVKTDKTKNGYDINYCVKNNLKNNIELILARVTFMPGKEALVVGFIDNKTDALKNEVDGEVMKLANTVKYKK